MDSSSDTENEPLSNFNVKETKKSPKSSESDKAPKRTAKSAFTEEEDEFLLAGIKKHGKGKWTRILKDPDYRFHPSRKNATLMLRAKVKMYI